MLSSFNILLQKDLFGCVAGADTANDKVGMHLNIICVWVSCVFRTRTPPNLVPAERIG